MEAVGAWGYLKEAALQLKFSKANCMYICSQEFVMLFRNFIH